MTGVHSKKGSHYTFMLNIEERAKYRFTFVGSSMASELAQMPVTLYFMGTVHDTFTWHGTGGEPMSFTGEYMLTFMPTRVRLAFAQNGIDFHKIVIEKIK